MGRFTGEAVLAVSLCFLPAVLRYVMRHSFK